MLTLQTDSDLIASFTHHLPCSSSYNALHNALYEWGPSPRILVNKQTNLIQVLLDIGNKQTNLIQYTTCLLMEGPISLGILAVNKQNLIYRVR